MMDRSPKYDTIFTDIINEIENAVSVEFAELEMWVEDSQKYRENMTERYNRIFDIIGTKLEQLHINLIALHQFSDYYIEAAPTIKIDILYPLNRWPKKAQEFLRYLYIEDDKKVKKGMKSEHLAYYLLNKAKKNSPFKLKFDALESEKFLGIPTEIGKWLATLRRDEIDANHEALIDQVNHNLHIRSFFKSAKSYIKKTIGVTADDLEIMLFLRAPCINRYEFGLKEPFFIYVPSKSWDQKAGEITYLSDELIPDAYLMPITTSLLSDTALRESRIRARREYGLSYTASLAHGWRRECMNHVAHCQEIKRFLEKIQKEHNVDYIYSLVERIKWATDKRREFFEFVLNHARMKLGKKPLSKPSPLKVNGRKPDSLIQLMKEAAKKVRDDYHKEGEKWQNFIDKPQVTNWKTGYFPYPSLIRYILSEFIANAVGGSVGKRPQIGVHAWITTPESKIFLRVVNSLGIEERREGQCDECNNAVDKRFEYKGRSLCSPCLKKNVREDLQSFLAEGEGLGLFIIKMWTKECLRGECCADIVEEDWDEKHKVFFQIEFWENENGYIFEDS